ncbi:unnamed protein product [Paramecium primaurelia]|uniref:Uncharacterized protein n=1 Tax=Paramecium primaurelia TaxID=5886 RepID=A0A8S1PXI5_PARPR|nr:unnamed protein product [Paramecium primaurelia]
MSTANDIGLIFSYVYDKISKIHLHNVTQSLSSIKIQLELILGQMDEVTQNLTYSNLEYLFDWAKACQQSMKINFFQNQEEARLMHEINQILLEIFQYFHNAIDKNFMIPQSTICIANELGNIITQEDNFMEVMGNSTLVNFAQFIDVYATPNFKLGQENIDNAQATFYKLNYGALERVFTSENTLSQIIKNVAQQREHFFQRFQLNVTIGNFEFTKYDEQNQFFFYHPLYALNEEKIKKLLIVQFVALNYQPSIQLDEFIQSPKFADNIRKFYQKLINTIQDE